MSYLKMDRTELIRYKAFGDYKAISAFTTTKHFFLKHQIENSLRADRANFKIEIARILGIETENLILPVQTHSDRVYSVEGRVKDPIDSTDALVTNKTGVCLCVQTADCVPILLYDPKCKVIAAVHAGWRGTVAGIVLKTIQRMVSDYGTNPKDLRAVIGPSICGRVYEVGEDVAQQISASLPSSEAVLIPKQNKKYLLDLWEANKQQLLESQIVDANIEIFGECTYENSNEYFSARRDGIDTGRLLNGIMLRADI